MTKAAAVWTHNPPVVGSSPTRPTRHTLGPEVPWRVIIGMRNR
jgi:hypothetical protein